MVTFSNIGGHSSKWATELVFRIAQNIAYLHSTYCPNGGRVGGQHC